ncbi:MAG: BamA/TamA family outer membrane protein [Bacteroidales bacterium]|nr:BamA/TamA family outer membrane protein [Bacteroidales bacterium]
MKYLKIVLAFLLFYSASLQAQEAKEKEDNVKTGWNFGLLPVVSFNSDLGFQYGLLTNFYNYGDGSNFPKYNHSLYAEVSRYTKGSGIFRVFYDSEFLIPQIRLTADLSYLPDQALDFYGFNGYDAVYDPTFTDENTDYYKTRMFYKHQRNILRFKLDFQGKTPVKNLNWAVGYNFMDIQIGSVPIDKLNEGKDTDEMLPTVNSLYDNYVEWGIIKPEESKGAMHNSLKVGLVYDTRDNEPCPMKGLWSEVVLFNSYSSDFTFGKLAVTHRQYFTIVDKHFSFAYRVGYQGIVYGDAPFYLLPYMIYSYMPSSTVDGLGGSKSVRGMIRNRTVGKGNAFANLEFRYKFVRFRFIKQNWYAALNPFLDAGMVVQKIDVDKSKIPSDVFQAQFFANNTETVHLTYGCGLHLAMNENFVIAADIGLPVKTSDGKMGVYIGMNWLF